VLPDFLASAGGVIVAYFEQVRMLITFIGNYGVPTREAAYLIAVSRVAEACKLRGWT
jgi:glutamate dehydrogenase/leucine dehydrogenase